MRLELHDFESQAERAREEIELRLEGDTAAVMRHHAARLESLNAAIAELKGEEARLKAALEAAPVQPPEVRVLSLALIDVIAVVVHRIIAEPPR